ncbi:guanine deaminase [Saccharopolyspora dendranthemae]|uniref:Guanine deaminase n=2 Tax=Saccharopolyspora dendranthemae TaxID=1181886 RepID=A0A561U2F9_9PSEU|nr:nucleoside deaminase [Saccharopolyspora dendranthemae]TWF93528.1 guanine deaminase [Saccharopolyspora dendranthemae]
MSVDVATQQEHDWMTRAIELATTSVHNGGGPFGAVIVRDGEIVATGNNRVTADLDPTAHAEVVAIRNACRELDAFSLAGCMLVTSCEPCPMCLASAMWARVERVLFAADRDDAAAAGFDDRAFYDAMVDPAQNPTAIARVEIHNRNEAFDAWRNKTDRVDY